MQFEGTRVLLVFKNPLQVITGAACVALISVLAMLVHVEVNYPADMQGIVRPKALIATVIVSFPISYFFIRQIHKNYLLTLELQKLVDRDRLTDAATRDYFFTQMEAHPDAYGVSLMVDIDHFKQVNDAHGHIVGDGVIRSVAQILRQNTRPQDIVCRFGGEEFVIFLFGDNTTDGFAAAERMRVAISGALIIAGGAELSVTVSIGGALKDRMADLDEAIRQADVALYRAKRTGRNRTIFYARNVDDADEEPRIAVG